MCRRKLLTMLMLVIASLTSFANEPDLPPRGCRVGRSNPQHLMRRASLLRGAENALIGNRRQLVVLASFQDKSFLEAPDDALQKWNIIFNTENYQEGMFVGSVHDYFLAQSYGQLNLTFDLIYVALPDNRAKYCSTFYHDENSQYMVDDIVDALTAQEIDWNLYDWDGDTFIDQLLIVFAGEGQNAGGGSSTIWPHQWWLSQHLNQATEEGFDYRSYRTVTYGGKDYHIDCYCCAQEEAKQEGYNSSFGIICHEYTHCFGLPDFYSNSGKVVGSWDLMDDGQQNGMGFTPCNYSAHERMLMGWLTPIELSAPATITDVPALCDEPAAYLIRNDGAENEYYIIENRQQRGWDEGLPASGIVVFHVDYDKDIWRSTSVWVNTMDLKRYHIFPANNRTSSIYCSGWAYPYVGTDSAGIITMVNDSLTNTSLPAATLNNANADGELLMSKSITRMSVTDNGLASFVFMGNEASAIHDAQWSMKNEDDAWYDLQGRKIQGLLPKGIYIHSGKKVVIR